MIKFYIEEGTLYRNKERIILTKTEFLILKLLMFLSIVIFISCLMIVSFGIGEDGSPGGNVYEIMDSSGNIINIKSITRLGGWIEKLDEDCNIIESWGEKKTLQNHYTKEQFYELIASNQGSSNSYIGYINYHKEGGHDYYLYVFIVCTIFIAMYWDELLSKSYNQKAFG